MQALPTKSGFSAPEPRPRESTLRATESKGCPQPPQTPEQKSPLSVLQIGLPKKEFLPKISPNKKGRRLKTTDTKY